MTDINIDFHTHRRFSNIWDELDIFRDIASAGSFVSKKRSCMVISFWSSLGMPGYGGVSAE